MLRPLIEMYSGNRFLDRAIRVLYFPNDNEIVSEAEHGIIEAGGRHATTARLSHLSASRPPVDGFTSNATPSANDADSGTPESVSFRESSGARSSVSAYHAEPQVMPSQRFCVHSGNSAEMSLLSMNKLLYSMEVAEYLSFINSSVINWWLHPTPNHGSSYG